MRRLRRFLEVLALTVFAAAAYGDEPLRPPEDFVNEHKDAVVTGLVDEDRTIITQIGVPGSPSWSIPVWARWYSLGPQGASILVMQEGGNLIGSRDPQVIAATVWYLEAERVQSRAFRLGELTDPETLPSTTSNYLLYTSITPGPDGWLIELGNGRKITITYR